MHGQAGARLELARRTHTPPSNRTTTVSQPTSNRIVAASAPASSARISAASWLSDGPASAYRPPVDRDPHKTVCFAPIVGQTRLGVPALPPTDTRACQLREEQLLDSPRKTSHEGFPSGYSAITRSLASILSFSLLFPDRFPHIYRLSTRTLPGCCLHVFLGEVDVFCTPR